MSEHPLAASRKLECPWPGPQRGRAQGGAARNARECRGRCPAWRAWTMTRERLSNDTNQALIRTPDHAGATSPQGHSSWVMRRAGAMPAVVGYGELASHGATRPPPHSTVRIEDPLGRLRAHD